MNNIARILGLTAEQQGSLSGQTCPTVALLDDGRIGIVGATSVGDPAHTALAAHTGPGEQAVTIPFDVFLAAAKQILAEQH